MMRFTAAAAMIAAALLAAPAQAQSQAPPPLPLLELVAPDGQGRFYTLHREEAETAVFRDHFKPEREPVGYMWPSEFPGSQPAFRLRFKSALSYLVTSSTVERASLVADGRFLDDGVLGHAAALTMPKPPGMVTLWRYSRRPSEWRLVLDSDPERASLERQGYRVDGRIGYVYPDLTHRPPAQPDADRDGVSPPADCDDTSSTVRPGAAEFPGNGIDEDCDGTDRPAKLMATLSTAWSSNQKGARVTRMRVSDAPARAKITVLCRSKRCPFRRREVTATANGTANLKRLFKRRLRPGVRLEVRITAPHMIGKVVRYEKIRPRQVPSSRRLCLAPGASQPSRC